MQFNNVSAGPAATASPGFTGPLSSRPFWINRGGILLRSTPFTVYPAKIPNRTRRIVRGRFRARKTAERRLPRALEGSSSGKLDASNLILSQRGEKRQMLTSCFVNNIKEACKSEAASRGRPLRFLSCVLSAGLFCLHAGAAAAPALISAFDMRSPASRYSARRRRSDTRA